MSETHSVTNQRQLIEKAVNAGIINYIQARKTRVNAFVDKNFSFKGALKLHSKALGKDLYKVPLNILWSLPMLPVSAVSLLLDKAGLSKATDFLNKIPRGFQTEVEKEFNWLIYAELLELPYQQEGRETTKDALLEAILNDPELSQQLNRYLVAINEKSLAPDFHQALERNLAEYATSRTAASDLAGSIITLSSGYVAFHKVTPGVLASGGAAAAAIAQQIAIAKFWMGPALGAWYYGVFPATASTGLIVAATGSIMAGLALIMPFTGILTDPLQSKLGMHQKRLYKFLDALQDELLGVKKSEYRIKDQYLARVFDIFDLLRVAMRS